MYAKRTRVAVSAVVVFVASGGASLQAQVQYDRPASLVRTYRDDRSGNAGRGWLFNRRRLETRTRTAVEDDRPASLTSVRTYTRDDRNEHAGRDWLINRPRFETYTWNAVDHAQARANQHKAMSDTLNARVARRVVVDETSNELGYRRFSGDRRWNPQSRYFDRGHAAAPITGGLRRYLQGTLMEEIVRVPLPWK